MNLTGSTLGSYEILQELGRGGMATVYLGFQQSLQRNVAIKVLTPGLTHDPQFVERFMREARLVARLNHPNIVRVHTVSREGRWYYLVMDYADGGTVDQRLQGGRPLDWPRVLDIGRQVAQALDHAHGLGIIHRDVKPSNILLTRQGQVMLADFGIAVAVEETRLTLTGGRWGTAEYMAPEQALGQEVGPAADVYALAAVVYEMATGRPPFQADAPVALLHQHVYGVPSPPRKLNRQIPESAQAAILRALAKSAPDRFSSAGDFARALAGEPGLKEATAAGAVARPRPTVPVVAGALLALILIAAVLGGLASLRNCTPVVAPATASPGLAEPAAPTSVVVVVTATETQWQPTATVLPTLTPSLEPATPTLLPSPLPTWTPSPEPTKTPVPGPTADPLRQSLEQVIWRYAELKALATGPSHDASQLANVLVGEALEEQVRAVKWQSDNNAYYDTTLHWMRIEWVRRLDDVHAEALVTKKETFLYYPDGWTEPSERLSCRDCEYQILYKFSRIGDNWYIAEKFAQD